MILDKKYDQDDEVLTGEIKLPGIENKGKVSEINKKELINQIFNGAGGK